MVIAETFHSNAASILDLEAEVYRRLSPDDYFRGLQRIVLRKVFDLLGEPKTPENKTKLNCAKELEELLLAARRSFNRKGFYPNDEIREALSRALKGLGFESREISAVAIWQVASEGDLFDYVPPWAQKKVEKRLDRDVRYAQKLHFLTQNLIHAKGMDPAEAQEEIIQKEAFNLAYSKYNPHPPWSRRRLRVENDIFREDTRPDNFSEDRLVFLARQEAVFISGEDEAAAKSLKRLEGVSTLTFRPRAISIAVRLEELAKMAG